MTITLRVLGPTGVLVGGVERHPGGPMPRALLARLIVAHGETVSAQTLIDELWHGDPPTSASSTLQSYVSMLRRILEPAHGRGAPTVLVRRGPGYALDPRGLELDADLFVTGVRRARELLGAGDPAAAAAVLDRALALWHGPAYADVCAWPFAVTEAARLDTLRAGAREDRLGALIDLGDHEAAAAGLAELTAHDPLRERAWELLALAHYRAGRQGEALATIDAARRVLADELGADPGPALTSLHRRLLVQDPDLLGASPAPAPIRRRSIPAPVTSFIGRHRDLERLGDLLTRHRLVTVTGPGGIGKTRVAVAVAEARNDDDGPWFVEFAGSSEPEALIEAVARVVGLTAAGGLEALIALLRERRTLLVFDDCDQAAGPIAALCSALLTSCPGVTILATSRVRLGVAGERVEALAPLPEGADLFYARAALTPAPTERDRVRELCAALDDLPLAIELAAARTAVLSVPQLGEMLDRRFALLSDTARGADPAGARHASMQAVIDGSYQALDDSQRALFCALSVFAGGFDLAAAAAVTAHPDLLDDLTALVDRSMVSVLGGDPRRYRLLETLREYGREQLSAARAAELTAAHVTWVRGLVARAHDHIRGARSLHWTRVLDEQLPNVHAALEAVAETEWPVYLEIVGHLYWFWYRRGYVDEGMRLLAPLTEHDLPAEATPIADRVRATAGRCLIGYLAGDLPVLLDGLQRLEELYETGLFDDSCADDRRARADAAVLLGFFQAGAGAFEIGRERAELGARLALAEGYDATYAEAQMALGMAAFRAGEHDLARELLAHAATLADDCGYAWLAASSLWISVKNDIVTGDVDGPAQAKLRRMLAACERAFDLTSWMVGVLTAAYLTFLRGDRASAALLTGVVRARTESTGFDPEHMDIVELAPFAARMRAESDSARWAAGIRAGAALDRAAIDALLDDVLA
ncbi:MAG: BTAD domain-containing putative transcriptional regulator [Gordonia sp. (in: high G+C Gram-positive bacteria)]|uniref:BTAD domain-containing putative transcriptional regulator n=1 Tax=Gordonia sp. (in: high G+C Gram-positive bacteria) TaxID=84139 RepID=UPI0039E45C43